MHRFIATKSGLVRATSAVPKFARNFAVATETQKGTIMTAVGPLNTTHKMNIINTAAQEKIPVFQIMDQQGKVVEGAIEPKIDQATAVKMMEVMVRIHSLDDVLYNAQRQGRISFYMQAAGEEAIHVGKAHFHHVVSNSRHYFFLVFFRLCFCSFQQGHGFCSVQRAGCTAVERIHFATSL